MLGRIFFIVMVSLGLAGCAAGLALQGPPSAERPGTQITLKNPDATKWLAVVPPGPRKPGTPTIWACRPIACSDHAVLAAQSIPSPTRNPDAKTLETAAKLLAAQTRAQDIMLEAASDGETRLTALSNKVTQVRGYPAILAEMKRVANKKTSYLVRGDVFVGLFIVKVTSMSDSRQEAGRNFDALVAAMDIIDVAPGAASPADGTAPAALDNASAAPEPAARAY